MQEESVAGTRLCLNDRAGLFRAAIKQQLLC